MKGRNRAAFSASCRNNSFAFPIQGFPPISWFQVRLWQPENRLTLCQRDLLCSGNFSPRREKVNFNPSALSALLPPAPPGQGLLPLTHTLLLPAKSLHLSSQSNSVVRRCVQAPLTKLVQIRKVIDSELCLYFPQGEGYLYISINFWVHRGITCPSPFILHLLGHTRVHGGQGTAI